MSGYVWSIRCRRCDWRYENVVKSDVEQHARWHRDQHKQLDAS